MENTLKEIAVLQAGIVSAAFYTLGALIMTPFMLVFVVLTRGNLFTVIPMIIMLILYPLIGFIAGVLMALIYNFVASWVGGLRFTLE